MKRKSKILYFIISIVIVIISILGVGVISSLDLNIESNTDNVFSLNINKDSELIIKDKKLYCDNKKEFIEIKDGNNILKYNPIEIYDSSDYYFIVFSMNQDELINEMFLDEDNYKKRNTLLYIVDRENGLSKNMFELDVYNSYRYKLDTITFLKDDLFYMEVYEVNNNDLIYLSIFHIKELVDDLYLNKVFLRDKIEYPKFYLNTYSFEKYAITNDLCLIQYYDSRNKKGTITLYRYEFEYDYVVEDNEVITSSFNSSYVYLHYQYKYEEYLNNGYFINKDNTIYYLDNKLIIREIYTDKEIKKLNNINEWNEFINN